MKDFKNVNNYPLDELKTIFVNTSGDIIGAWDYVEGVRVGSTFKISQSSPTFKVLEYKRIFVVEEVQ